MQRLEVDVTNIFKPVREVDSVAENILKKRYYKKDETTYNDVAKRVVEHVLVDCDDDIQKHLTYKMILNRHFVPNSPCLVNAGTKNGGLLACFVIDFNDSIEEIYKTKLEFALIAKKGGGCGTTLSKLRPESSLVNGSSHGYAGGPIKFFDTICYDMKAITQSGFRSMAMMGTMSVYHPDIIKFITAKTEEGKMTTTNISVTVDDEFMQKVENDETYFTRFKGVDYQEYKARDIFNLIIEHAWKNGEPGILFYNKMNDSPYKYSNQEILATNPCGEQPLPINGSCNLGNFDLTKFLKEDNELDLYMLELAVRLGTRFLDAVIDTNSFPTEDIKQWAYDNRPLGLGIMGLADYYLRREIAYGSEESIKELEFILNFIYKIAEDESIQLGEEKGIPKNCEVLPVPRRNITLLSIAPTGTTSLIAGCSSSIEPIFSEITVRNDKTGVYQFNNLSADSEYFRCAVSTNGNKEVTWKEHVLILDAAQKFVDAGVSKTINFPNHTRKETIYDAFMLAWKLGNIKGMTVYRNGSRKKEVLSPKKVKQDKCPVCNADLQDKNGTKVCTKCEFVLKI